MPQVERTLPRSRRRILGLGCAFAFAIWLALQGIGVAHGAPPEGADPALAPWFQGLQQPVTGASCCSISDCRPVAERVVSGHYEALVGDQFGVAARWVEIPNEVILSKRDNPLGKPVLCWTPSRGPLCYVRGIEA